MRIFIGFTDVANIAATYADGFRALGHEVFSVVWSRSPFYPDSRYDVVIDSTPPGSASRRSLSTYLGMAARLGSLWRASDCDLFIMFAPAVLPSHLYYPALKALGKRIVTAFWGSDIRYWFAFAEEMRALGVEDEVHPFFEYVHTRSGGGYQDKARTVRVAEKYSDLIISQPDCAQLQSRPYMRANVPLDLSKYEFHVPGRLRPLILHAPSVPEAKGTDIVLRTVDELRSEGLEFDFRLIEAMPNVELRRLLSEADILVDELFSSTIGSLSAEGMATGNVVLVRYMPEYCKVPVPCPAVNVNLNSLKENLQQVILDLNRRQELAAQGRPYVEACNDHISVCRDLLRWLEKRDTPSYDFHPSFVQQLRLPADLLEREKAESSRRRTDLFRQLLATGTIKTRPSKPSLH